MEDEAFWQIFVTEAEELIANLEQGIVELEADPGNPDPINRVFRALHTLKGNAGMGRLQALVRFTHAAEQVLSRMRDHEVEITTDLVSLLLRTSDGVKVLVAAVADGGQCELSPEHDRMLGELATYARKSLAPATPNATPHDEKPEPLTDRLLEVSMDAHRDSFATGQDPAQVLAEIARHGEVEEVVADVAKIPPLFEMDPTVCYLSWRVLLRTRSSAKELEDFFVFGGEEQSSLPYCLFEQSPISVRDVTDAHPRSESPYADKKLGELLVEEGLVHEHDVRDALQKQKRIGEVLVDLGKAEKADIDRVLSKQAAARDQRRNASIRVDMEKLERLMNLVGEMAIAVAHMNQLVRDPQANQDARICAAESLEQIERELQAQVMGVRMVPIEDTFHRMRRAVRDLAQEQGKYVMLETSGTETELDKIVVEQLADPLRHMIRNCVAHGIESPAERIAARKSDTGTIRLRAAQEQDRIIIEITDDGRGIDPDRVLAKAVERGLVPKDAVLSEREVLDLIFLPGFSTAEKVDEVSGRGVGLDVVRKNVNELHGRIELDSKPGRGTRFRISLPLTLAIVDGMNVRSGTETLTIPVTSIVALLSLRNHRLETIEGKGEMIDVRGEFVPVARVQELFELPRSEQANEDAMVVVVETGQRRFGLLVDFVLGTEQAVVKPIAKAFSVVSALEAQFRKADGIAGATILGDGSVALILDVPGVERMAFGTA